ncbi:MAG: glutamate synthase subunit beta [Ruminococcus sp.]|uniref:glutamate synthase subunit beta n=1 Tax=Ruminococcus sp. TaxID=41978 RepID=UPI001B217A3B|nr:glutamate synthase subunit beta [Ruminococcus sp.]MBO7474275.1 glutamate synthase subunit beta [Ruminococcus sp.]MBP1591466.1 glutamate synthase subunit beta [Oscillospiraceae bacterium]
MGKYTGFLEYTRTETSAKEPLERIKDYNEFHVQLSEEQRCEQAARCMDCGVPFCQNGKMLCGMISGCPLNNLIPEWNDLLYHNQKEQALKRLLMTNNFPEFTSRVCPALCEKACICGVYDSPVTVKENENSIIEFGFANGLMKPEIPEVRSGKRIAVIGSGPSGLAAADTLNKRGHSVTVFERSDRIGGLLMYGIPNMKLEKHIIERRTALMQAEGVEFRTSSNVGENISADEILNNYDAVILACGSSNPRDIKAEGRDADGIYFAVDFLKATTKSLLDSELKDGKYISAKDKNVVIIGGGDTGNDCVGTSVRHGCKSVVQLEMMPKLPDERAENNPFPEWPRICKTDYGQEEAIAVFGHDPRIYCTTVKEFIKDEKGALKAIKTVKLEFIADKATGRKMPHEIEGSEEILPCELCLIAAGFLGCQSYIAEAFGVELDQRTNVKTAAGKHSTNINNVFTAGDMHIGQSLVVRAIREGRDAAAEVDEYLMGYTNL